MSNATVRYDPTLTHEQRRQVITDYALKYPFAEVFIETGTAFGDTVTAVCELFHHSYTIEVSPVIYKKVAPKLAKLGITCLLGDSEELLPELLAQLDTSCFFWLDGHWCGDTHGRGNQDTPVAQELETIFATKIPHVVLVDDARLFGNDPNYPTIDWVRNIAVNQDIRYDFAYIDDIMRITPR